MVKIKELRKLPVSIASLDALALLLAILGQPKEEIEAHLLDGGDAPDLRAALEWCAARGLVTLSHPGWSTIQGAAFAGKSPPSVGISFLVQLTDRGRALANLLPVVR
jgi:hypothetical protein